MKLICFFSILIISSTTIYSQQVSLLSPLQSPILESSGLLYLNDLLISHNDSGADPKLYELDSLTGNVTRTVVIANAQNIDWEDICHDDEYIYIADFGNNSGSRTDLKVYRLSIASYLSSLNDTVYVDTIRYSYEDQIDFTPTSYSTNFDAEAIISYGDSLYIFTKNWGNSWTNVYSLTKTPGDHQVEKIDSMDVQCLISGATYDSLSQSILLVGYTSTDAFIVEVSDFTATSFSEGTIVRSLIYPSVGYSFQFEAITPRDSNLYYLTTEAGFFGGDPGLYQLNTSISVLDIYSLEVTSSVVYPNPSSHCIYIRAAKFSRADLHDSRGIKVQSTTTNQMDVSALPRGEYYLVIYDLAGRPKVMGHPVIVN